MASCGYCHGARTPCICTADCGTRRTHVSATETGYSIGTGGANKTCPQSVKQPEVPTARLTFTIELHQLPQSEREAAIRSLHLAAERMSSELRAQHPGLVTIFNVT